MSAAPQLSNTTNPLQTAFMPDHISELESWDELARSMSLRLEHLTPVIGTVIHGVDLRDPLSAQRQELIYQLLVARKVIFFRDQDLTPEDHIAFSKQFGELEVHPFARPKEGYPEILVLDNDAENPPKGTALWHSDVTWRQSPSLGSVLLAREVPASGGDTCWANMEAAWEGLADELKAEIDGLIARHDSHGFRAGLKNAGMSDEKIAEYQKEYPIARHPVVRTHPDSQRKSLYVNRAFTLDIEGVSEQRSEELLSTLCNTASRPEYQCRFRWQKGSVAFWDNRAAQHYALADYWPARRSMERVTIIGDKPV